MIEQKGYSKADLRGLNKKLEEESNQKIINAYAIHVYNQVVQKAKSISDEHFLYFDVHLRQHGYDKKKGHLSDDNMLQSVVQKLSSPEFFEDCKIEVKKLFRNGDKVSELDIEKIPDIIFGPDDPRFVKSIKVDWSEK